MKVLRKVYKESNRNAKAITTNMYSNEQTTHCSRKQDNYHNESNDEDEDYFFDKSLFPTITNTYFNEHTVSNKDAHKNNSINDVETDDEDESVLRLFFLS